MIDILEVSPELAAARTELDAAILARQRAEWAGTATDDHEALRQRVIRAGAELRDIEAREREAAEQAELERLRVENAPALATADAALAEAEERLIARYVAAQAVLRRLTDEAAAFERQRRDWTATYAHAGQRTDYPPAPPATVIRALVAPLLPGDPPRLDVATVARSPWAARVPGRAEQ